MTAPKKLADLDPAIGKHPSIPGGWCISFTCPACGPPHRIIINAREGAPDQARRIWSVSFDDDPTNSLMENMTITPSIDNSPGGHGRNGPCAWHGSVTDGMVVQS